MAPSYEGPLPEPSGVDLWPGRFVAADGIDLHVRELPGPDDEKFVFVHGLGGSSTNFTDLGHWLAGRAGGLAVDLPGFGRTRPPEGFDYSQRAHTEALATVLDRSDLPPVHLVGNSMGGAIALRYAARHPDRVRTLTLLAPAVPDLRPDPRRAADPRMFLAPLPLVGARARAAIAAATPAQRVDQMLRLCYADPARMGPEQRAAVELESAERAELEWAPKALYGSGRGLIRTWLAGRGRVWWSHLARVSSPTLVLWGDRDRLISPRKAVRTALALPGGRLMVLRDTGHLPQMERPEATARAVLGLLDGVRDGTW